MLAVGRRQSPPASKANPAQESIFTSSNMTQDLNPQNDEKKTALCDACASIQQNWRRAPGHAELVQGQNRKEPRSHGQVTITKYTCDRCGTKWEYENNKVNLHAGWSTVGG
jgi:hypothetical protein